MNEFNFTLMKVLLKIKKNYYSNKLTYFNTESKILEKQYKEGNKDEYI